MRTLRYLIRVRSEKTRRNEKRVGARELDDIRERAVLGILANFLLAAEFHELFVRQVVLGTQSENRVKAYSVSFGCAITLMRFATYHNSRKFVVYRSPRNCVNEKKNFIFSWSTYSRISE